MLTKLVRLLERLTAALLGSLGVGVQVTNVMICVLVILLGPAFIFSFIPQ